MESMKLIGAFGLLLISIGIITKQRRNQDFLYIVGGVAPEAYSIFIGDPIFIVLQIIFTLVAIYDLFKLKKTS